MEDILFPITPDDVSLQELADFVHRTHTQTTIHKSDKDMLLRIENFMRASCDGEKSFKAVLFAKKHVQGEPRYRRDCLIMAIGGMLDIMGFCAPLLIVSFCPSTHCFCCAQDMAFFTEDN